MEIQEFSDGVFRLEVANCAAKIVLNKSQTSSWAEKGMRKLTHLPEKEGPNGRGKQHQCWKWKEVDDIQCSSQYY